MAGLSGKIIEGMMIDMLGTGDFYPMKTILQKSMHPASMPARSSR